MIYRELVLFTEKSYDLLRKAMIYREIQLFFEIFYALLNYDFTKNFIHFETIILTVSDMILC